MVDTSQEGKKVEVLARIDHLRELVVQDAPEMLLEAAHGEVGRSLDGLMRPGRGEGELASLAAEGEPRAL